MTRLGLVASRWDPGLLTTGEETLDRRFVDFTSGIGQASGSMRGAQFVARKTETVTQVRVLTVGAAAATPTICRIGIYTVDAANLHTLVASTANDTTLFAAGLTAYTKALSASFSKVAGQRYALCILVVSAAAMPTFAGRPGSTELSASPSLGTRVDSQADLPASVTPSLTNVSMVYGALLP